MTAINNVFGANAKVHPVTGMPLESGIGATSEEQQAAGHVVLIEKEYGKEAADAMRKKLGIKTAAELAKEEEARAAKSDSGLAARVTALEKRMKDLEGKFVVGMKEVAARLDEELIEAGE